jgi:hypothetical protein
MTKEELERQTEELARQLQHAIDHWDDPDQVAAREAHLREKEDHQRAVFEESYLRTGQRKPDDSLEEAIGKITRFLAQRIERGEERVQPCPYFRAARMSRSRSRRSTASDTCSS